MARPRKYFRDPKKAPRDIYEIQAVHEMAKTIYLHTGGVDIDVQIDGMTHQQAAFNSQMGAAKLMQSDENPGAWGPTISAHASSLAAGHATRLLRLREQKMARCIEEAEEHFEAKKLREAGADQPTGTACPEPAEGVAEGTVCPEPVEGVPEVRPSTGSGEADCPRPSNDDDSANVAAANAEPLKNTNVQPAHACGPQSRGPEVSGECRSEARAPGDEAFAHPQVFTEGAVDHAPGEVVTRIPRKLRGEPNGSGVRS